MILVAVVVGFGATLFFRVRSATLEQVDADLLGAAQVVATNLQQTGSTRQLEIPDAYRHRFGMASADAPYLVVWAADGRVQLTFGAAPADLQPAPELPATEGFRPFFQRNGRLFREVIVRGPADSQILVGRQIGRERNELRRLLSWLLGTGLGIVGLGLTWAWFLSRRILAPIEQMTGIAERISVSNLSERIDELEIKSELGRLAQVLNRMFGRLQASFERQVRFTADASHELRTPTSVVLAQSELALAKQRSPEEYKEALGACYRAAKRMESLVDGLLTLARIDARQLEICHEPVDLRQVVESSVALLKPLADQKQIELKCDLETVQVTGDAKRLCQVVANLVNNAITYNHEGGYVRLHLAADEASATLSVSDTGIGIGEGDLPRIFERFYRVDKVRTGNSGGIGLAQVTLLRGKMQ
ncbi:MAG: ATP-binding protein [Thermoguttaceae bacterium]